MRLVLALMMLPGLALADAFGTTNPEELTMNKVLEDIDAGRTSMTNCAAGYLMTKSGRHGAARKTFEACAGDGYPGAMTWMGYLDNNGFGGDYDPDAAAEWDRRAAEAGDSVGQFNYGLSLLRGYGVPQDEATGRALIDAAARTGLPIAQRLQSAGYDPEAVTPDADNWRYAPMN
ncbi:tetratricopeptide repeat protein [Loktanella sp. DJP18]|uniref:tetratricopeptide repeat protein n=1 Tax=Loktanella sp. DJP18 TaxID=3409788 RepID=UPI003BB4EAB1